MLCTARDASAAPPHVRIPLLSRDRRRAQPACAVRGHAVLLRRTGSPCAARHHDQRGRKRSRPIIRAGRRRDADRPARVLPRRRGDEARGEVRSVAAAATAGTASSRASATAATPARSATPRWPPRSAAATRPRAPTPAMQTNARDATWAVGHPELVVDFAYRAIHVTTENAQEDRRRVLRRLRRSIRISSAAPPAAGRRSWKRSAFPTTTTASSPALPPRTGRASRPAATCGSVLALNGSRKATSRRPSCRRSPGR